LYPSLSIAPSSSLAVDAAGPTPWSSTLAQGIWHRHHVTPETGATHPPERPGSVPTGVAAADPGAFAEVVGRAPMHRRDRVPGLLLRLQDQFTAHLEHDRRRTIAIVIILVALFTATAIASARILLAIANELDLVAYLGLFLVNWLGNGGGLVPIPGARYIGLLMIFQQAVLLPAGEVWLVGGSAMALGLLSYYVAGARSAAFYANGEHAKAIEAVQDVSPTTPAPGETKHGMTARLARSWAQARERAQPLIERHGIAGMALLCFVPWPLAAGGAFIGGAMGFGFARFLAVSFAAKLALSAIVVLAGLLFAGIARALVSP
jgi:hypothetical protein